MTIPMNKIEAMGMEIDTERCVDGAFVVKGDNNKLQNLRKMLDEAEYIDDSPVACGMMGLTPAKETISFIMICNFGEGNNGYMAAA